MRDMRLSSIAHRWVVGKFLRAKKYKTSSAYANRVNTVISICEMNKIAWQKPFSSASDFVIK